MKSILFVVFFFCGLVADARELSDSELRALSITKGAPIRVIGYDPTPGLFAIVIEVAESIGPNYARPADLLAATSGFDLEVVERNPLLLIGERFELKRNLRLRSPGD